MSRKPIYSHNPYQNYSFPLLVLQVSSDTCYPPNEGFRMLHWHNEVQFMYLLEGTIHARIYDEQMDIHAGECLFINKNAVHLTTNKEHCVYHSYLIPEKMLSFFPGSLMEKENVWPITENRLFSHLVLTRKKAKHGRVLDSLAQLDAAYFSQNENPWFEYCVAVAITALWRDFISVLDISEQNGMLWKINSYDRIQRLLTYIHEHYQEELSLKDISCAANVSVSETQRTFRQFVGETPYQYLMKYRLHASTALLKESDKSISVIALESGFHSVSSFISYFKKQYGITPAAFRNEYIRDGKGAGY